MPDVPFSLFATAAATLMVTVAACGSAGRSTKSDPTSASTRAVETLAPAAGSVRHRIHETGAVRVARTAYGRELVDRRGFALYLFTHDRSVHSSCDGACAAAWPPYVVAERPAHPSMEGTARREDGRLQVTYAGHPLYYYAGDRRPGAVRCQAVQEFGGTWYVVAPSGNAIH